MSQASPADLVGLVHLVDPQCLPVPPSQPDPEDPYLPSPLADLRVHRYEITPEGRKAAET